MQYFHGMRFGREYTMIKMIFYLDGHASMIEKIERDGSSER